MFANKQSLQCLGHNSEAAICLDSKLALLGIWAVRVDQQHGQHRQDLGECEGGWDGCVTCVVVGCEALLYRREMCQGADRAST